MVRNFCAFCRTSHSTPSDRASSSPSSSFLLSSFLYSFSSVSPCYPPSPFPSPLHLFLFVHSLFFPFYSIPCLLSQNLPPPPHLLSSPPSAMANNEDTIILSPPTTLTVQEGEAVTVPCVASGNQQPTFMFGGSALPTGAQSNQYSLDFTAITLAVNGSYSCQVGTTTSTFTINVLGRLHDMIIPIPFPLLSTVPLYPLPFPPLSLQL